MTTKILRIGEVKYTFNNEVGTVKVVKSALGLSSIGKVKAETIGNDIVVSLPDQEDRILAILARGEWQIWVTPKKEIHLVKPIQRSRMIADQYIMFQ